MNFHPSSQLSCFLAYLPQLDFDRVLQVHHWDRMPENNTRSNLVALCPRCHLELHSRGRGNVSEGQMGLLGVATHNHNRSGPQSSQFWDQINCNYPVS